MLPFPVCPGARAKTTPIGRTARKSQGKARHIYALAEPRHGWLHGPDAPKTPAKVPRLRPELPTRNHYRERQATGSGSIVR
jgi:hypothetical protein